MAYNSDGYIMIDFTEVDFRRTNQTIDGLYKRCVDVIGTNKFILVINANGRTPLPATCSFTNNQYVIDTCIYMFAINSNDNLFIRRNDVPASDIIDDSSISVDKTWSSNKINTELESKADTSALADYQPLLTAGTNINIDENNIISAKGIKCFEYTGDDKRTFTIDIPEGARYILAIQASFSSGFYGTTSIIDLEHLPSLLMITGVQSGFVGRYNAVISFTNNVLTLYASTSANHVLNILDQKYYVYYI